MTILVMGVSGSGKSTLAKALSARLDGHFIEADDFHPAANKEKMARGQSLDDTDRLPWIESLRDAIAGCKDDARTTVLACSALKEKFRDILRQGDPSFKIVFLQGDKETIEARLAARKDHFMPPVLVDAQLRALEVPADASIVPVNAETHAQVAMVLHDFGLER
jgi:gluconokinase